MNSWATHLDTDSYITLLHRAAFILVLVKQVLMTHFLSCFPLVFSLADLQRSSTSADQPELGASERGERPAGVGCDKLSKALAGAGLVEGEPDRWEDTELAAGAAGDSWSGY